MSKSLIALLTTAAVLITTGCANWSMNPSSAKDIALPTEKSMEMPAFAIASQPSGALQKSTGTAEPTYFAATIAYTAVVFWTTVVQANLYTPVELFKLVHRYGKAEDLPDQSGRQWTVTDANSGFSAALTGKIAQDSVRWSMSVSGGTLTDFVWYEGTSTITGKSGYWVFHDTAEGYPAVFKISYDVNIDGETKGGVVLSVIDQANVNYGNYIKWSWDGTARAFETYDVANDKGVSEKYLISWDAVSEAGSIENLIDNQKYCWAEKSLNHMDIQCR